jgi:hypothetical protein
MPRPAARIAIRIPVALADDARERRLERVGTSLL